MLDMLSLAVSVLFCVVTSGRASFRQHLDVVDLPTQPLQPHMTSPNPAALAEAHRRQLDPKPGSRSTQRCGDEGAGSRYTMQHTNAQPAPQITAIREQHTE
jgi:hypothetical protein